MKRLLLQSFVFLTSFILSGLSLYAQCPNLNFSMANFNYWQAYVGSATTSGPNLHASNPITGQHTIISAAQAVASGEITDGHCHYIQTVPDGYSYSCKLGNDGTGKGAEGLEYTMAVDSNNSLLILSFAYVLQQAGHSTPEQPTFKMSVRDTNGNVITSLGCSDVTLASDNTDPDLVCRAASSTAVNAKDWTTVGFSLEPLIGRTIKIRFETMDCTQSAHYGYAYFVAECRPMTIDLMYCEGNSAARLRAPEGFMTYTWTRSSDPSWRNNRVQINIQEPLDGEEFECEVTSKLGCTSKLRTIIAKTSIDAAFYYGNRTGENSVDIYDNYGMYVNKYDTCTRTATMVDLSSVYNSKKDRVVWEIHGLNVVSYDSLFTYTFPDPPTNEPIDYLIRMTVDAENGCADTSDVLDEHYIRIYPSPMVEILGPERMCEGLKDTLTVETLRSYFVYHEWGGITRSGTTISKVVGDRLPITGPGTYWIKSLDSVNCWAYDTIEVAPLQPNMKIEQTNILCYGEQTGEINHGPITGSGIITSAYWVLKDVNGNDSIDERTRINGKKYINLRAGTYTFYAIDADGCELQFKVDITQPDSLESQCSQSPTTCFLPNGTASVSVSGGTPPYRYKWIRQQDGVEIGTQSSVSNIDSGDYKVMIEDANGCYKEDSIKVLALPSPIIVVENVRMETCDNSNGQITISVQNAHYPITYTWTPNPHASTGATLYDVTGGDYHVSIKDSSGCQAEESVTVPAYPSLKVTGNTTPETCHRKDGTVSAIVTSGNPNSVSYVWTSASGQMSDTSSTLTSLHAGQYTITITDTFCTAQKSFTVAHIDGPTANFEANTYSIASNTVLTLTDASAGNLGTWNWNMGDGTTATGDVVYHTYKDAGDYKVSMLVADVNGCTDTISKMIHVYDELNVYIPNSFSPNGDDLNDTWGPIMNEYAEKGFRMLIYDRWGQRVFETEDPTEKWDGTVDGKVVAPNSIYSYIVIVKDFNGQEYEFVGHVTVLK